MTKDELRSKYKTAYKIIAKERRWREHVFEPGNPRRDEKLREMDLLLQILTEFKDVLKDQGGADFEQPALLDVPQPTQYR